MKMNIECNIKNKKYSLTPMISHDQKKAGLALYPICSERDGLIFIYEKDVSHNFIFNEVPHHCIVYFIDEDLNIVCKENTKPYQEKPTTCSQKFRYVIEIEDS